MRGLIEKLILFRDERSWQQYHTSRELARSLMIEAAELNRLFQWGDSPRWDQLQDEIADIMIYALYLAEKYDVDPVDAILQKMEKNTIKYPANQDI